MGFSLLSMSKKALRQQIDQRMLDVANTAAYQLDGDEIGKFTAEDVGSESYEKALDILRSFQNNIRLDYIYCVKAEEVGQFTFIIDPDPDKPGAFGSPVFTTEAMRDAAKGIPGVDKKAFTDEWGRFYSAYSPVFDSDGNVAGIVGVDFNADWYDGEINSHKAVVVILSMLALTIGIALTLMTHTFALEGEKKEYMKKLEETLQREEEQKQELGSAIHLAYTDPLTGVRSKHAYIEAVERIDKGVADGKMSEFGVVVFDINGLKAINDTLGHEEGDKYIIAGCELICMMFCHSPVYRIGGDEFAVILEDIDYNNREELVTAFNLKIEENLVSGKVVVSTGIDIYDSETDRNFSSVFERADKKMYERKRYLKSLDV
jgi:diguanylate cyclase (GGDEF)-like protein